MAKEKQDKGPPEFNLNPYIFTALLFLFGLWCLYDGWFTTDPDMAKHQLFNRTLSFILIPWAVYDFFKVKRAYKKTETNRGSD